MPRRYMRRRSYGTPAVSIKNVVDLTSSTGTTLISQVIAKAVSAPVNTVKEDVKHGCYIKALWASLDFCGLAATGVLQRTGFYIMKNTGNNLTPPGAFSVGTSNEKRWIFRQWQVMTMRNQDGNPPFHWEGWIKIPRIYQKMNIDNTFEISHETSTAAGHFSGQFIYKYKT